MQALAHSSVIDVATRKSLQNDGIIHTQLRMRRSEKPSGGPCDEAAKTVHHFSLPTIDRQYLIDRQQTLFRRSIVSIDRQQRSSETIDHAT